jgi:hypothetical protein
LELFKDSAQLLLNRTHNTVEGLKNFSLKASMNKGLTCSLKAALPNVVPVPRPLVLNKKIAVPNWLSGFVEADGCFLLILHKSPGHRLLKQERVALRFINTQHARDSQVLALPFLALYYCCGFIKSNISFY